MAMVRPNRDVIVVARLSHMMRKLWVKRSVTHRFKFHDQPVLLQLCRLGHCDSSTLNFKSPISRLSAFSSVESWEFCFDWDRKYERALLMNNPI